MAYVTNTKNGLKVMAYRGDFKTLLAFSFKDKAKIKNLAGFTIEIAPDNGKAPYYLYNSLTFKEPSQHAQVATEPAYSSINAPLHKFRWVHFPGAFHQGNAAFQGKYTYTITPRYFDKGSLTSIDKSLSVSVSIEVAPFVKGDIRVGMTRGFMQSQAFVHRFGPKALSRPRDLIYDTSAKAGDAPQGGSYTYADEYAYMGYTARQLLFQWLDEVINDKKLSIDIFAYDLNEPDIVSKILTLAAAGRVRVILDNADLHHGSPPKREDQVEKLFNQKRKGNATMVRGCFGRYSHDKIFIINKNGSPVKVLTGSTNYAVTGMYVNSNHVVAIDDSVVARQYAKIFADSLTLATQGKAFAKTLDSQQTFTYHVNGASKIDITFSPHSKSDATRILQAIADRVDLESNKGGGNVFFAVMELDSAGPATQKIRDIHKQQKIFSYGITDTTSGISLYEPGKKNGVLVTGKPANTFLPPPFDQVPGIGLGHQVHHKFVVCGFDRPDAVVYCGSSNLAAGGEMANGDNLLAIHDSDIATVFMIEAVTLVDHFQFLNRTQQPGKKVKSASKTELAAKSGFFLSTTDNWAKPYYDSSDLKCVDRELFAGI